MKNLGKFLSFGLVLGSTAALAANQNDLPIPGDWTGTQRCMEIKAVEVPEAGRGLRIIIRENEVFNEYGDGEKNSMFVELNEKPQFTTDPPKLIRSFVGLKVFSKKGNAMLKTLANALEKKPAYIDTYTIKENESVVKGKLFCDVEKRWCHFQATKRVTVKGKVYEVEGSDMMQAFGEELVRIGYAIDKFGCAPNTCTYVCESRLKPTRD